MNTPTTNSSNKFNTSKSVVNRHERTFKKGSLMFIEGEESSEMFIIRTGKIRILKLEGENCVELASLGPGSVLGELSLLDKQPRGATAQVIEDTAVTVIDEELFTKTLEKVPQWLRDMVKIVVKRLRDTMKKTSDDVVKKSVSGVIRVIMLLSETEGKRTGDGILLRLSRVKEIIYSIIGLSGMETENVFLHLILKNMILISKSDAGYENIKIINHDILAMYLNYLRSKQNNCEIPGEELKKESVELIELIVAVGAEKGRKEGQKYMRIGVPQIELEMEKRNLGQYINLDALDELEMRKLVVRQSDATETNYGTHKRTTIIYSEEKLRKILLFREWLPVFKEEVIF